MNGRKAKELRRRAWRGKGNPPGVAVLKEVEKPFSAESTTALRCWGPRAEYKKLKKKARK